MDASVSRVPCTVVTGFLGAGKTTLIRNLLENAKGKRLAIIVNEFGDVGIDGEILKGCGVDTCPEENIVELANGCICCTVADDFVPALDQILSLNPKVDHILIETSGLALPKPLVQAFQWPSVKSRVTVDGVVAVVDGPALADGRVASDMDALQAQRAADGSLDHDDPVEEVFEDQIACADLIILSKSDLMDAAGSARANAVIGEHVARAVKIVPTAQGKVDPSVVREARDLPVRLDRADEVEDMERRSIRHRDRAIHRSPRAIREIEADDDLAVLCAHSPETSKGRTMRRWQPCTSCWRIGCAFGKMLERRTFDIRRSGLLLAGWPCAGLLRGG